MVSSILFAIYLPVFACIQNTTPRMFGEFTMNAHIYTKLALYLHAHLGFRPDFLVHNFVKYIFFKCKFCVSQAGKSKQILILLFGCETQKQIHWPPSSSRVDHHQMNEFPFHMRWLPDESVDLINCSIFTSVSPGRVRLGDRKCLYSTLHISSAPLRAFSACTKQLKFCFNWNPANHLPKVMSSH